MTPPSRSRRLLFVAVGLLVVNIFLWSFVARGQKGELRVVFLDIGQGDAVFIESPSGGQLLIDGGAGRSVLRELSRVMPFYDRSLDVVLATHPDQDHIGGLSAVLEAYRVGGVIRSGAVNDTAAFQALNERVVAEGGFEVLARRGMVVDLGGGVFLSILFPDRDLLGVDPNAASVVARLLYGQTSMLLTGDSPRAIEEYLAAVDGPRLQSSILKVGHHGSDTSSAETFLGFVAPEIAVIQAGRDNRYGHPHAEVLERLERFGIEIRGTYEEGAVGYVSDGEEWRRSR